MNAVSSWLCVVAEGHEAAQHDELGLVLTGQLGEQVVGVDAGADRRAHRLAGGVGGLGGRPGARGARVEGDVPGVVVVVEGLRVGHVVAGPHVGLHPEEVLGVAQVVDELVGHLVEVGEQLGEGAAPGVDDRVLVVDHVEVDGAVVGVDHRLDRVAHVVEVAVEAAVARQAAVVGALRVGVPVGRGVGVDDPLDLAVVVDHRIRVGVELEERRQRLDPLADVADVVDLGVARRSGSVISGSYSPKRREKAMRRNSDADADAVGAVVGRVLGGRRPPGSRARRGWRR